MACTTALSQIATAIKGLEDTPENEKQLLLVALPNAFGPNLHKFQKEFIGLVRKSLEKARAGAADALIAANQQAKEAQTVLEASQADVEATKGAEEAARCFLDEKLALLEKAQADVKTEEATCQGAEAKKAQVATNRQKLEAAKAEVESVKNGSLQMLCEGGWEDEEVRDACIDIVCNYLRNDGADAVLLAALPKALRLRPSECGAFDRIAVDEAGRVVSEKLDKLAALLAEGESEFEDVTAEHLGAWAILDVAREREQAASEACDGARAALGGAAADAKLAVSKRADQEVAVGAVLSEATLVESRVRQLEAGLGALAQLEASSEEADKENVDVAMAVEKETSAVDTVAPVAVTA